MKLLLFATFMEAEATLRVLGAVAMVEHEVYQFECGYIVISGMGILAAQRCVFQWASKVDSICNLGVAASLQNYSQGEIFSVATLGSQAAPLLSLQGAGVRLFSSHFPVHSRSLREKLGQGWDIVDMEGYGVASAALYLGIPCSFLKIVSDFAVEGGIQEIQKNITICAALLAQRALSSLK